MKEFRFEKAIEENYRIKLSEFLGSREELAIYCNTLEETKLLFDALHFQGARWRNGESYKGCEKLGFICNENCYTNKGLYGSIDFYKEIKVKIYDFNEVNIYA